MAVFHELSVWQAYLISAKSKESLNMLTVSYQAMFGNASESVEDICSTAALHRNHMQ